MILSERTVECREVGGVFIVIAVISHQNFFFF